MRLIYYKFKLNIFRIYPLRFMEKKKDRKVFFIFYMIGNFMLLPMMQCIMRKRLKWNFKNWGSIQNYRCYIGRNFI